MVCATGECIVEIPPRIHVTLFDMRPNGWRVNGGIGFTVDGPITRLRVTPSKVVEISDRRPQHFGPKDIEGLRRAVERAQKKFQIDGSIKLEIEGETGGHQGFGSGTRIRLGALEAMLTIYGCEVKPKELYLISGRGRTSGVGVHTYFNGGLIIDLGHKPGGILAPSEAVEDLSRSPLMLSRLPLPDWGIGLCLPMDLPAVDEAMERAFFEKNSLLTESQIQEAVYHAVFGLSAAILEEDISTFCEALKAIQSCAWKAAERNLYGERLLEVEAALYRAGACGVGMSSFGPLLFFLGDIEKVLASTDSTLSGCRIWLSKMTNNGRVLHCA